ncbi:MAG: FeoB-associated Cys-rich membrane protein [Clostridium sp.]|nr:FeoB-associated Cys-rich membrane protein [Clostridium sp.]
MEIIITLGIIVLAIIILTNTIKKKKSGGCNCGSCSSKCPMYKEKK